MNWRLYSITLSMMASTLSLEMTLRPVVRVMMVSGVDSRNSMRSLFTYRIVSFNRVTWIISTAFLEDTGGRETEPVL